MPDQLKLAWMSKVLSVCPCQQYGALRHWGINLSSLPSCCLSLSPKRKGTHGLYSSVVFRSYNSYFSSSYFFWVCTNVFHGCHFCWTRQTPISSRPGSSSQGPSQLDLNTLPLCMCMVQCNCIFIHVLVSSQLHHRLYESNASHIYVHPNPSATITSTFSRSKLHITAACIYTSADWMSATCPIGHTRNPRCITAVP
jgi:hypothetical protein